MMKLRYVYFHLKALIKRRSTWVVVITLVLLFAIYNGITFPSIENTSIGIVTNGSERAEDIISIMEQRSSIYNVVICEDEESLEEEILSGSLECGFIFCENFDSKIDRGRTKETIKYIYSPYTTKGLAAKESLSSAFVSSYSNDILTKQYNNMFGSHGKEQKKEITEMLIEKNNYYMEGNDIFEVDFR